MRYFAYGSNMSAGRLRSRTPSAKAIGTARLSGYALRFRKRGRDGSAKCDIEHTEQPSDVVIGVIYHIDDAEIPDLDRAEDLGEGYARGRVPIELPDGEAGEAWTYLALPEAIDCSLLPFDWYVAYVLAGAREHDLPESYISAIEQVEVTADTDSNRAAFHFQALTGLRQS